jgi:hypothetical protein
MQTDHTSPADRELFDLRAYRTLARELGPGWLGSLSLHGALVLLLILFAMHRSDYGAEREAPIIPVDVIRLGQETTSPSVPQKSVLPQQRRQILRGPKSESSAPESVAPNRTRPTPDDLELKLRALSKLRAPDAKTMPVIDGASNADTSSDNAVPGDEAAYAVRDYVRAQVMRHWNLDFGILGKRTFAIPLHVVLARNGDVKVAEIVDHKRYAVDAIYRRVALSARNAVLLSSPIVLPADTPESILDMTIKLDPRDAVQ